MWKAPAGKKQLAAAAVLLLGILAAGCAAAWLFRTEMILLVKFFRETLLAFLQKASAPVFFGLMSVLPACGAPVSVFYVLAGAYGRVWAVLGVGTASAVNLTLAYWLARGILRPPIERFVRGRGWHVPDPKPCEHAKITWIIRLTPGMPYPVQSYLLGLARVHFRIYFLISWPLQFFFAAAFMLMGESFFTGRAGLGAAAACLFIILFLLTRMIRERYGQPNRKKPAAGGQPGPDGYGPDPAD